MTREEKMARIMDKMLEKIWPDDAGENPPNFIFNPQNMQAQQIQILYLMLEELCELNANLVEVIAVLDKQAGLEPPTNGDLRV